MDSLAKLSTRREREDVQRSGAAPVSSPSAKSEGAKTKEAQAGRNTKRRPSDAVSAPAVRRPPETVIVRGRSGALAVPVIRGPSGSVAVPMRRPTTGTSPGSGSRPSPPGTSPGSGSRPPPSPGAGIRRPPAPGAVPGPGDGPGFRRPPGAAPVAGPKDRPTESGVNRQVPGQPQQRPGQRPIQQQQHPGQQQQRPGSKQAGPKRSLADALSVLASAPPASQPSKKPKIAYDLTEDDTEDDEDDDPPATQAASKASAPLSTATKEGTTRTPTAASPEDTTDEAVDYIAKFLTGDVSLSQARFPDATILTPGQLNGLAKTIQAHSRRNSGSKPLHGQRAGKEHSKGDSNLEKTVSALQSQILKLQGRNAELKASLQSERDHYEEKLEESRKVQERSLRAYMKATVHSLQMLRKGV
jgi:hypothetical protein